MVDKLTISIALFICVLITAENAIKLAILGSYWLFGLATIFTILWACVLLNFACFYEVKRKEPK